MGVEECIADGGWKARIRELRMDSVSVTYKFEAVDYLMIRL